MREGWKIIVNPKFESFRKSIESIPFYVKDKGEIIYSDRNTIYRLDIGGVDATVKEFHIPAPFNRFVYSYLRHSKARRSFDNAIGLASVRLSLLHILRSILPDCLPVVIIYAEW